MEGDDVMAMRVEAGNEQSDPALLEELKIHLSYLTLDNTMKWDEMVGFPILFS